MDAKQFVTKIRRLHEAQGATIRFNVSGMNGLWRLNSLLARDVRVHLADRDKLVMWAVLSSHRWEGSQNRNYMVYGLPSADEGWLGAMARDVESINVSDHGAKSLVSGRQKMRDLAVTSIKDEVQTEAFVAELQGWGIAITACLEDLEELPVLVFRLVYNNVTIASVGIDGWSGRILIDGQFSGELFMKAEQVQKHLRDLMEPILDRLTAAA